MTLMTFMRSARANNRYLIVPKFQLFRPLIFIWTAWLFISFLPTLAYVVIMLPVTLLCMLVIAEWYDIWKCFGYAKASYVALNIFVIVAARVIGVIVQDGLLDLLLDWRIFYAF